MQTGYVGNTVASGEIDNKAGDYTFFTDNVSAGSTTIINESGDGSTGFYGHSTAADATILNHNGSLLDFGEYASGGNAAIINVDGGFVKFGSGGYSDGPLNDGSNTIGSIAGQGTYLLGNSTKLTVGSNNTSTEVTGRIYDNGSHGSLTKVGTGVLRLSGDNNFFSGGITLKAGTVDLASPSAAGFGSPYGFGAITFTAGAQTLILERTALDANGHFGNILSGFNNDGDILDLQGIGTAAKATLDSNDLLTVQNAAGALLATVQLAGSYQGMSFQVGDDGLGGTDVSVSVDTRPPGPPTLSDAAVTTGTDGKLYVNAANDTAAQALTGTAEAGSTVTIYDGTSTTPVAAVQADPTGAWSYKLGVLADGSQHSYAATATDAAGNVGPSSGPQKIDFEDVSSGTPIIPNGYHGFDWLAEFPGDSTTYAFDSAWGPVIAGGHSLFNAGGYPLDIQKSDGSSFNFDSIDLGQWSSGPVGRTVTLTGYKGGTSIGSKTFSYNGVIHVDASTWGGVQLIIFI